jgi:ABC-type amino acid transport substrate-binding protein
MKGRLIGGVLGADGEDIIREIGGFRAIRVYPGAFEEFNDFLAGRLDMLIVGDKQASEFLRLRPGAGKIVGQPYSILYTGIPVRKGATALKSAIDQAIRAAREDGTIDSLAQKYFHIANFTKSFPPVDVMPAVK